jgi:hypothetical protein
MAEIIENVSPDDQPRSFVLITPSQRSRLLITLAALACFALTWGGGALFQIPTHRGFEGSLLIGGDWSTWIVVIILVFLNVCIGTLIAGSVRFDAGLFSACIGLAALSYRAGPMRYVLFDAASGKVYLGLLTELLVLYVIVGVSSSLQTMFYSAGMLLSDTLRDSIEETDHPTVTKVQAAAMQIVVMAVLMLLLAQTDKKNQVIASVAIASFAGTALSYQVFPVHPSMWYWIGPLVVGAIGYAWAFQSPGDWRIGVPANNLAAPLPLDYASVGPAFAIMGYWMARRWRRERESGEEE